MAKSNIEWTDYSWNFISGCNKVSAGCKNCYAETIAKRFWKDRKFTDVQIDISKLELPLHLKKPRMIFVNSMSDLFHDKVPLNIISEAWSTMRRCENKHIFQILTKRPERMEKLLLKGNYVLKNIWLGVSVENQQTADERIPLLLQTPAAVRWLSIEPMLDKIYLDVPIGHWENLRPDKLTGRSGNWIKDYEMIEKLDWVVVGCESGHNRRECKLEWVEDIVRQCKEANVPVFVKQIQINGKVVKDIEKFPTGLRIRQFPNNKS